MNFNLLRIAGVVGGLLVVANGLRSLESRIEAFAPTRAVHAEQLKRISGRTSAFAVIGGLRSAVASMAWLRTNLAWEKRDVAETTGFIEVTVAADERPLYFWLNGARMITNDIPEWRVHELMPLEVRRRINEEQARRALAFLEDGLRWHGAEADIYVEMANIHWRRLGDLARAASYYRLAAEQPGAPYYAGRIYAELLVASGSPGEALAWLEDFRGKLPSDDPGARVEVVEARIAALKAQLNLR
ncbi:hypothetical protein [Oleiharenicola lentus]|uniref:hypothetical protein n=1 Tax=Oleiharenicola lentus TaxID=2508720 RepID=UPI003F668329